MLLQSSGKLVFLQLFTRKQYRKLTLFCNIMVENTVLPGNWLYLFDIYLANKVLSFHHGAIGRSKRHNNKNAFLGRINEQANP